MAITKKQELRALTESERELVAMSGVRAARALTDTELNRLVKRLRTRRDRARTVADRQRREMRGKARPRGATPPRGPRASPWIPRRPSAASHRAGAPCRASHGAAGRPPCARGRGACAGASPTG